MGDNEYYESVLKLIVTLEWQELKALRLDGEIIFTKSAKDKLKLIQKRYGGY